MWEIVEGFVGVGKDYKFIFGPAGFQENTKNQIEMFYRQL